MRCSRYAHAFRPVGGDGLRLQKPTTSPCRETSHSTPACLVPKSAVRARNGFPTCSSLRSQEPGPLRKVVAIVRSKPTRLAELRESRSSMSLERQCLPRESSRRSSGAWESHRRFCYKDRGRPTRSRSTVRPAENICGIKTFPQASTGAFQNLAPSRRRLVPIRGLLGIIGFEVERAADQLAARGQVGKVAGRDHLHHGIAA